MRSLRIPPLSYRGALFVGVALFFVVAAPLRAQTLDDGLRMPARTFCGALFYSIDYWDRYWEGTLNRDNESIGTVSTKSTMLGLAYGITEDLTAFAMLPYVSTNASEGPLRGQDGLQDLTLAAKYQLMETPFTSRGTMQVQLLGAASLPVGDYTPDFMPLSIGTRSRRAMGRVLVDFTTPQGWFAGATASYTARSNVRLDRESYYTDGELYLTDEVDMPNVVDYAVRGGFQRGRFYVPLAVTAQHTLGGGDIRRQDMPFVSNRMDALRVEGLVSYTLPLPGSPSIRLGAAQTLAGRNVGESTTITGGVLYQIGL